FYFNAIDKIPHRILEHHFPGEHGAASIKFLPDDVRGERDGAPGMLLFTATEEVGGIADLRFDFLLAITVVVVGDERHDHATRIAARQFEGGTVVVEFVLVP